METLNLYSVTSILPVLAGKKGLKVTMNVVGRTSKEARDQSRSYFKAPVKSVKYIGNVRLAVT